MKAECPTNAYYYEFPKETFKEIMGLDLNFFRKKMINFESKKNTIKHKKKAPKYPKL